MAYSATAVAPSTHKAYLTTPVLLLMAVASGLCAGGNYFNQPLLHSISVSLGVAEETAAYTVTLAQMSYALGLVFLVPLGDKLERRGLAVGLMLLAAAGQLISGLSSSMAWLSLGTAMAGLFSVAAQVLVPTAAALSDPQRSGRAVGLVMSGLLIGILAARSVAGVLSDLGGWNTVYWVSSIVMLMVAIALWFRLPPSRSPAQVSYGEVLRSLGSVLVRYPRLRSRALLGALSFASVGVLFSTMALLLSGPAFGLGDTAIGLVGLAGIAGALMANVAGRMADQGMEQVASAGGVVLLAVGWLMLWLGGSSLIWFLLGMLVVDLALQTVHVSNQNVVYSLEPAARSRINSVYMTGYFIGGGSGSALGTVAWQHGGWSSTCVLGLVLATLCAGVFLRDRRLACMDARTGDGPEGAAAHPPR